MYLIFLYFKLHNTKNYSELYNIKYKIIKMSITDKLKKKNNFTL